MTDVQLSHLRRTVTVCTLSVRLTLNFVGPPRIKCAKHVLRVESPVTAARIDVPARRWWMLIACWRSSNLSAPAVGRRVERVSGQFKSCATSSARNNLSIGAGGPLCPAAHRLIPELCWLTSVDMSTAKGQPFLPSRGSMAAAAAVRAALIFVAWAGLVPFLLMLMATVVETWR